MSRPFAIWFITLPGIVQKPCLGLFPAPIRTDWRIKRQSRLKLITISWSDRSICLAYKGSLSHNLKSLFDLSVFVKNEGKRLSRNESLRLYKKHQSVPFLGSLFFSLLRLLLLPFVFLLFFSFLFAFDTINPFVCPRRACSAPIPDLFVYILLFSSFLRKCLYHRRLSFIITRPLFCFARGSVVITSWQKEDVVRVSCNISNFLSIK